MITTILTALVFVVGVLVAYVAGHFKGGSKSTVLLLTLLLERGYLSREDLARLDAEVRGSK